MVDHIELPRGLCLRAFLICRDVRESGFYQNVRGIISSALPIAPGGGSLRLPFVGYILLDRNGDSSPHWLQLFLLGPARNVIARTQVSQLPANDIPTIEVVMKLDLLELPESLPGDYRFVLQVDGRTVGVHPFRLYLDGLYEASPPRVIGN
jgi:hypothetical protein